MLVKLGVDISRLNREIRRTLRPVDVTVGLNANEEAVITSTYEGNHMPNSLHYSNDAYDIRYPKTKAKQTTDAIKISLGQNFDVVPEDQHIHIEYDPK